MKMIYRLWLAAFLLPSILLLAASARADVRDNAHIFSQDAIDKANAQIADMEHRHGKGFIVETFPGIPPEMKDQFDQQGKDQFFPQWLMTRAQALQANGVYALICMDPRHIELRAGRYTREHGDFTRPDEQRLVTQMKAGLGAKQYDETLLQAVDFVERAYTANIHGGSASAVPGAANAPQQSQPGYPAFPTRHGSGTGFGIGSLLCVFIGVLILISLVKSIFRGHIGGGSGYYPQAGPGYGPGYGAGPGYGGGGGGFGRGFLGGLLGGALGGYAADRYMHPGDQNSGTNMPPSSGGTFGDGGGGSFDSGPSDAGQGFGGDSGGGGGDFGGGGGGGGSSGGDF